MGADPPQDPGKGEVFHDNFKGFPVPPLSDHLDIPLDIESRGTGEAAGGLVHFLYGKGAGNGLSVFLVGGLPLGKALVVLIGKRDGAGLGAIAAGRALCLIQIARVFVDGDIKMSGGTIDLCQFRIGDQFDVQMPADLDQFG